MKQPAPASLEQCALQNGPIHRIDPALKLLMMLAFECCVISCAPEQICLLPVYLVALLIIGTIARISPGLFFRRLALALPFAFFTGIWGCFYDHYPATLMGFTITRGELSFLSILLRTALCVGCVLIYAGTTRISMMAAGMRRLHIPQEIVSIFELMWRYLSVLTDEARNVRTAWMLRNGSANGISLKYFGSLLGGILVRSIDRAQQIHTAMICRGYPAASRAASPSKIRPAECIGAAAFTASCILYRVLA
ncbi:MAG: cobalt ECF transporter T component CbiQ [Proteobacteria bacterium]|nr:cobalt ECF transporter T component CbiQ [Pseudomonadota bacterium]